MKGEKIYMKKIMKKYYELDEEVKDDLELLYIYQILSSLFSEYENVKIYTFEDLDKLIHIIQKCMNVTDFSVDFIITNILEILNLQDVTINDLYDLELEDLLEVLLLKCPECGADLKKIGTEVVRQEVEYVPEKLKLKTYVREVYKCEKCGTEESEKERPTIVKTKTPRALLAHSFASSSLATEVIYQKYYMGVPLYRQEKSWDDKGLVLPRSMTSNWCIKLSEYYLEPIYNLMLKKLKENSELLHCDETTMQCNKEPGKKASSNSYMWVITSGELEKNKGVIFNYSSSRSSEIAQRLLKGYKKIIVTDWYSGYNILSVFSNFHNVSLA